MSARIAVILVRLNNEIDRKMKSVGQFSCSDNSDKP